MPYCLLGPKELSRVGQPGLRPFIRCVVSNRYHQAYYRCYCCFDHKCRLFGKAARFSNSGDHTPQALYGPLVLVIAFERRLCTCTLPYVKGVVRLFSSDVVHWLAVDFPLRVCVHLPIMGVIRKLANPHDFEAVLSHILGHAIGRRAKTTSNICYCLRKER